MNPVYLRSNNIVLRDWILEDLDRYKYWLEPKHEWHNLDGPYYRLTPDEAKIKIFHLRHNLEKNIFPDPRPQLVIADKNTNELMGLVSSYWQSKETFWLSAGLSLFDPATWKNGYGFEAAQLWVDYLFQHHNEIVRLDFRTWSGNQGMIKLALKLGFKEEARFRDARIVNGKYYDGLAFGILRSEWNVKKN
ncbi:MAG: GNAT family N-acetyltransferase [Bdellovibrio sp.]|nr:GNAT family N-acetyltransferase [Bdellovibrio sp.]